MLFRHALRDRAHLVRRLRGLAIRAPHYASVALSQTLRGHHISLHDQLVKDIQNMGLPAIEAGPGSSPQIGDGVIRGYIVSTEGGGAGNMVKRMVIGFGAGTAEMDTRRRHEITPNQNVLGPPRA